MFEGAVYLRVVVGQRFLLSFNFLLFLLGRPVKESPGPPETAAHPTKKLKA
jgi:hypothetical protein